MNNNIFTFIDNYIRRNGNQTYADIKNGNLDNNIKNMLSREELEQYEDIKQSDYNRLLKFS